MGESYFQFSEEKKRLFQAFRTATDDDPGPASRMHWPDLDDWSYSPFESVRSGDILDVFGTYLREVQVRTCSALLELQIFSEPGSRKGIYRIRGMGRLVGVVRALRSRLRRKADFTRAWARGDLLRMMDKILSETGYLQPGLAFAIYQKRT